LVEHKQKLFGDDAKLVDIFDALEKALKAPT
jgi:hypothetical protein